MQLSLSTNNQAIKAIVLGPLNQKLPGTSTMNTLLLLSLAITAVAAADVARKPKLFYVSTSATTSTLSTGSICYISSKTALGSCVGRKRRSLVFDGQAVDGSSLDPSQARQARGAAEVQPSQGKEGRFLLYWITTTSISTSTSFTTTLTISSVLCTPSGVTLCG